MRSHFCPECGQHSLQARSLYEWRCELCGFHYYQNCAAAVAGLLICQGELLLTIRAKAPGLGGYDLPGGFVDADESLEQALSRELKEELAIEFDQWRYLSSSPNTYQYDGITYKTTDAFFIGRLADRPVLAECEQEIAGTKWLPISAIDLNTIAFPSVREAVARLQAGY